jgi:arsenate reductase
MKDRVLILCTGNSARSQMAEGILRSLAGDRFDVFSAGTKPSHVNPFAIEVMAEMGIDIRSHHSKSVQEFLDQPFLYVITVCDSAAEACPVFPGPVQRLHWSFPDPAAVQGTEEECLQVFRQVRDAIQMRLKEWICSL